MYLECNHVNNDGYLYTQLACILWEYKPEDIRVMSSGGYAIKEIKS